MNKRLLGLVLVLILLAAFGSLSVLAAETAESNGDDTTLCELNLSYRTPSNVKTVELLDSDGSVISPDTPTTSMAKPAIYHVPKGEYRYKAYDKNGLLLGVGSISVDSDTQTYQLFPMTAKSNVDRDITYTATLVETETGNVLEQGTPETETGEGTYFSYHWCPAVRIDFQGTQRSSIQYTYTVTPTDSKYAVESDTLTIKLNSKIAPSGTSFSFNALLKLLKNFYVTKNSNFHLFSKGNLHYFPFTEYIPYSIDTMSSPDYDIYTFTDLPRNIQMHYTIGGVGTQYEKYCDRFRLSESQETILSEYDETDVYIDIEERLKKLNNAQDWMEANLYTNVDDAKYLQLNLDETFRLEAFRTWQVVADVMGNHFVEPDFHYEVIGDSITLEAGGAPGREYQTITPVKEGISVIKITYDAITSEGGEIAARFKEIDSVNTGVVIVNVGGKNDANIETNIDQTEFDTIYYISSTVEPTGETTPGTDHAEYTFTPTANDALTVRVHDPLHNTQWTDESAWTTYEANPDGSYTVDLKEGRNIIEVSAGEDVQYHVVNCHGLVITVENETNPGSALWQGDTGSVSFTGLSAPIQKMAAIYNPGFPDTEWVEYHDANGEVVRSKGVQYVVRAINTLEIEFTEAGEYVLSGGQIHCGHLGSALGAHRNIPESGLAPNLNAGGGANSPYFSTLPDITLTVKETPGYVPPKVAAVNAVISLIDAIGDVTLDSRDAIEAARNAYDALDEEQQVQITNYDKLVAAEEAYAVLTQPEAPKGEEEVTVTFTVSCGDDIYAPESTGEPLAQATLTVPYFDLADYGLTTYYYNPDCYQGVQTGGTSDSAKDKVTLLHALIYATEVLYEGIDESEAGQGVLYEENRMSQIFNPTGDAGSLYFNPLWDFGYNLNYYVNYEYPLGKEGIGATADQILLADGDVISLHGISKNSAAVGTIFSYLRLNGERDHATVMQGNTAALRLYHAQADSNFNGTTYMVGTKEKVYINSELTTGISSWTEVGITDSTGAVSLDTSNLELGTYYIAAAGFDGAYQTAPAVFVLTVAENTDKIAADKVIELIDAIGDVTLSSKDDIDAARAAYDALTEEQKALVGNYQTLLDAEASYEAQLPPVVPGKLDFGTAEKTEPAVGFSDVASGDWFADAVSYVYQNGLMNGTGDGKFSPNANTTRGMIVTILARLEGVDTTTGATWYEAGRQWAMKNGISDGTSMDSQITREQLATMLYRYAQLKGRDTTARAELSAFADASGISDWAAEAMQWAVAKGLIQGSSNQLTPTAPATRAQVATILMRFIG